MRIFLAMRIDSDMSDISDICRIYPTSLVLIGLLSVLVGLHVVLVGVLGVLFGVLGVLVGIVGVSNQLA